MRSYRFVIFTFDTVFDLTNHKPGGVLIFSQKLYDLRPSAYAFFRIFLDWPQSLMSFFSKTDNLSKIAIYKLYLE